MSFKRARKQNYVYKVSSDNKILASLIKKACCTCTFLNHFRETNEQYASCFDKIDFVVIPSYIELPCYYLLWNCMTGLLYLMLMGHLWYDMFILNLKSFRWLNRLSMTSLLPSFLFWQSSSCFCWLEKRWSICDVS